MNDNLMTCNHLQSVFTYEYVSLIVINQKITENYNGEPYMWLSERINEEKSMYELFNCPGGLIYHGESEEEALFRETMEETTLNLMEEPIPWKIGTFTIENNENQDMGIKVIHVYELITSSILVDIEFESLGPWKLYSFREVLELPVIDTIKWYMCRKIKQLLEKKQFLAIEGTVGAGKSTLIENYIQPYWNEAYHSEEANEGVKIIPEAALSDEMRPKLKELYEEKITLLEFQEIIESKYFEVLCEQILFDKREKGRYLLDRSQISTIIFSKKGELSSKEIKRIKKNREYFDEVIKKGHIIFIKSTRERVLKNKMIRARKEEEAATIKFLEELHDAYYYLMRKAYKPIIVHGTSIIETISIINNSKNINSSKNRKALRKQVRKVVNEA